MANERYALFYNIVKQIPYGHVLTYGEVAKLAGLPRHARQVGYALAALKTRHEHTVPWHRVVNADGYISRRAQADNQEYQRILLESEGLLFDARGKIIITHPLRNIKLAKQSSA